MRHQGEQKGLKVKVLLLGIEYYNYIMTKVREDSVSETLRAG